MMDISDSFFETLEFNIRVLDIVKFYNEKRDANDTVMEYESCVKH